MTPEEAAYNAAVAALRAHDARRDELATEARKAHQSLKRARLRVLEERKP